MSKTYNMIGSLSTLKARLNEHRIDDFKSLKEVMDFQRSFATKRQQLIAEHESLIAEEQAILSADLSSLDTVIAFQKEATEKALTDEIELLKQQLWLSANQVSENFIKAIIRQYKRWQLKRQLSAKEGNFDEAVQQAIGTLLAIRADKNNRLQFITAQFVDAVQQSAATVLTELDRKKAVIDQLNSFIYGALGEQKVVKALKALSDAYYLINDFSLYFSPAIYHKQENDYIKSIQIDHLLVGPQGVFLIETKNWSAKSIENLSLRSPVEQIKRSNFVLFRLLNNETSNFQLGLKKHHWGSKKVAIKNLIVMTHSKPKGEFQYVKVLTVKELLGYIEYFESTFSDEETHGIAEFLLALNARKTIDT